MTNKKGRSREIRSDFMSRFHLCGPLNTKDTKTRTEKQSTQGRLSLTLLDLIFYNAIIKVSRQPLSSLGFYETPELFCFLSSTSLLTFFLSFLCCFQTKASSFMLP